MPTCTQPVIEFPGLKRQKIQAEFSGGIITSDGGVLLLREIDRRLGLLAAADWVIPDPRYIEHGQLSLLRQRVYGIALGYEDLNDHRQLRRDPAMQTAVNRDADLGSQATLCRLENRSRRRTAVRLHEVMV